MNDIERARQKKILREELGTADIPFEFDNAYSARDVSIMCGVEIREVATALRDGRLTRTVIGIMGANVADWYLSRKSLSLVAFKKFLKL
jgi:hypothetical protein